MTTVLITAFEPYDDWPENSSWLALLDLTRDLPPQLRTELLQGAEEGYPAGYESLLKSYFKALSQSEK